MITIDADSIIANLFLVGFDKVTVRDLNAFREQFMSTVKNIHVDVSSNSIIMAMAMDMYPNYFKMNNDEVILVQEFTPVLAEQYFNWRVPKEHINVFREICRNMAL